MPKEFKPIASVTFNAHMVREYSAVPMVDQLGEAENEMILWMNADKTHGFIEWNVEFPNGDQDGAEIGLQFENRTITDYDGVFSLSRFAVMFLRRNGFKIPQDFIV